MCVHGHFYQPPRENPWLETIEVQDSAFPYHDWNERIASECYGPNSRSRILDGEKRILRIANNYERISFNFGPTLLAWMEAKAPETYRAILDADRASGERFSGHGSAMAQAYNHVIMPLASARDRRTQVIWGMRDFAYRFGRTPEGMWLPEAAVDVDSLEALAEHGIRFTVLSPYQAARSRRMGGRSWRDAGLEGIDPSMPYRCNLPSGRAIDLFFYDGPISRAVAFEGLLNSGERFAARLMDGFSDARGWAQLVNIATDGESYGHHHRHGDMALAYALDQLESGGLARLTNYGEFLDLHPASQEVEIRPDTSWSCSHGIERWRSDCGCSGGQAGWNQAWRGPLRAALDILRDGVESPFADRASELFHDPWRARDAYIDVVLDRSPDSRARFLAEQAWKPLAGADRVRAWKLMELQRHSMLMYTSCGWFFDDVSGIETVQLLQYAGRVIQLAREVLDVDLEPEFLNAVSQARSNLPEQSDGAAIYLRAVRPSVVELPKVAAHHAVSSLFEPARGSSALEAYSVERHDHHLVSAGRVKLAVGRARIAAALTEESLDTAYAAMHFGDHNVNAAVELRDPDPAAYEPLVDQLLHDFRRADLAAVIRVLDRSFVNSSYSLPALFRDAQRSILAEILDSNVDEAAQAYGELYDRHAPLMRFLRDIDSPQPQELRLAASIVLERRLLLLLAEDWLDPAGVGGVLAEAEALGVPMDAARIRFAFDRAVESLAGQLRLMPNSNEVLQRLRDSVALARRLPFELDLWSLQNIYWELLNSVYPAELERVRHGDEAAARWLDNFLPLGEELMVRVELEPLELESLRPVV